MLLLMLLEILPEGQREILPEGQRGRCPLVSLFCVFGGKVFLISKIQIKLKD